VLQKGPGLMREPCRRAIHMTVNTKGHHLKSRKPDAAAREERLLGG
jgi:hypothetical protein